MKLKYKQNKYLKNVAPNKYKDDQIKCDEVGGACSTCRGEEKYIQGFDG
jgi:hypothetical protein